MNSNDRAVAGGNNPPPAQRIDLPPKVDALLNDVALLSAAHPQFSDEATLVEAATLKKRADALWKETDAARKDEKRPHDDAGKEVQQFYAPLMSRAEAAAAELTAKMKAELSRRQAAKEASEREARHEAARLQAAADKAGAAAHAALEQVADGVASEVNHIEAKQAAIEARTAAVKAADAADRIASTTAGVRVEGAATVRLTRVRKVRLAFNSDDALREFASFVLATSSGPSLTMEMTRIANLIYREQRVVPPGCEEYDEERVS